MKKFILLLIAIFIALIVACSLQSDKSDNIKRDGHGRIHRSSAAKTAFKKKHPCPATGESKGACRGWIIDHIEPLACGGADSPANMQWQTTADAKAKDKWERDDCK